MHLDLGKMRICQSLRCRSVGNKALGQCRSRCPSPLPEAPEGPLWWVRDCRNPTFWAVCSAGDSGDGPHGLGSEGTSIPARSWARAAPRAPTPPRHCTSPVLPFPVGGVSIGCRPLRPRPGQPAGGCSGDGPSAPGCPGPERSRLPLCPR